MMWGFVALAIFVGVLIVAYWQDINDLARWWINR